MDITSKKYMTCLTSKGKGERMTIRLPQEEKQMISELASQAGIKPSELVRLSLRSTLDLIRRTSHIGDE